MSGWAGGGGGGGGGPGSIAERVRAWRAQGRILDGASFERNATDRAQVCVVGTGAGGASVALALARAGHSVLLLEEGDYELGGELGTPVGAASAARDPAQLGRPSGTPIGLRLGRCVGGTTVLGAGTFERPADEALDAWASEHGASDVDAATLRPYFERVAEDLGLAPVPDVVLGRNAELLATGARRTGREGERVSRGARGCLGSGVCLLGCPQDAKQAMHVSYVPLALSAGASLYTRVRAREILVSHGRAFGVAADLLDRAGRPTGQRLRVVAERVVVACGALLTPHLLAQSGLGAGRPHLGRHLRLHPTARLAARFPEEVRGWAGVPEGFAVRALESEGISIRSHFPRPDDLASQVAGFGDAHKEVMGGLARLGSFAATIQETSVGTVQSGRRGRRSIRYRLRDPDRRRLQRALGAASEMAFAAGAEEVYPALRSVPRVSSPDEVRTLVDMRASLRDFRLDGWHPIGTARMSDDARHGVTDSSGRVHGLRDLYVADASLFPASTGPNPQWTVMALALRIGDRLAAGLGAPL